MSIEANKTAKVPRVGSKGILTVVTLKKPDGSIYNLTNTNVVKVEFELPNGTRLLRTGTKVNPPGTDGLIQYLDTDDANPVFYNPIAKRGTWWVRGVANNADGTYFPGSWVQQPVGD